MPITTTGIVEKRGIIMVKILVLDLVSMFSSCLNLGTTTRARYITPPIQTEEAILCTKSIVIGISVPVVMPAPWPIKEVVSRVIIPTTSIAMNSLFRTSPSFPKEFEPVFSARLLSLVDLALALLPAFK
jgi:hypothetical protein